MGAVLGGRVDAWFTVMTSPPSLVPASALGSARPCAWCRRRLAPGRAVCDPAAPVLSVSVLPSGCVLIAFVGAQVGYPWVLSEAPSALVSRTGSSSASDRAGRGSWRPSSISVRPAAVKLIGRREGSQLTPVRNCRHCSTQSQARRASASRPHHSALASGLADDGSFIL